MVTITFSVPDNVKKAFDRAFKHANKSAVIADLMRRAVAEVEPPKQRADLFKELTARRAQRPSATDAQIRSARVAGR